MKNQGIDSKLVVPFNAFDRLYDEHGVSLRSAFDDVCRSGWLILGDRVRRFEGALATAMGVSEAIGVGNGMDALVLSLEGLGLRPGDLVVTTPLTAFATTAAIVRAGGVPVFVDVDDHGLMDIEQLRDCLRKHQCRFVMPVHLYGQSLNLDELLAVKAEYQFALVEDVAQAIGAKWRGVYCGTVGEAGALSFYPTKNLGAFGDGGAILTNNASLATHLRCLRNYGQTNRYIHEHLGANSRLDELQAAILNVFLPSLENFTMRRRAVANRYIAGIRSSAIQVPLSDRLDDSVWHLFPVLTEAPERLISHLDSWGIQSLRHYPVLCPEQKALSSYRHISFGNLEKARRWSSQEVSLPCHPHLSREQLNHVIDAVNSYRHS